MTPAEMETAIIRRVVDDALAAGYSLSVFDGEEYPLRKSRDADAIMGALFAVDEDALRVYNAAGVTIGWVFFVHGNGDEVISDSTDNPAMSALLAGAGAVADYFVNGEPFELYEPRPEWSVR